MREKETERQIDAVHIIMVKGGNLKHVGCYGDTYKYGGQRHREETECVAEL